MEPFIHDLFVLYMNDMKKFLLFDAQTVFFTRIKYLKYQIPSLASPDLGGDLAVI